jgi:hypothetical protein
MGVLLIDIVDDFGRDEALRDPSVGLDLRGQRTQLFGELGAAFLFAAFPAREFRVPVNASVTQSRLNAFNLAPKCQRSFRQDRKRTCFSVPLQGAHQRLIAAAPESRFFASLVQTRTRNTRKERPCPTTQNRPLKSLSTRSLRRSGATTRRRGLHTRSPSSEATRTPRVNGRARTASMRVTSCWPPKSWIWRIRRFPNSGPAIVRLSSLKITRHSRPAGQGALTSVLPLFPFLLPHSLQNAGRAASCILHDVTKLNRSARETQRRLAGRLILRFGFRREARIKPRRPSGTKSREAVRDFVQADNCFRFGLDRATRRCAWSRPKPLSGETKKVSACPLDTSAFFWLHSLTRSRVTQTGREESCPKLRTEGRSSACVQQVQPCGAARTIPVRSWTLHSSALSRPTRRGTLAPLLESAARRCWQLCNSPRRDIERFVNYSQRVDSRSAQADRALVRQPRFAFRPAVCSDGMCQGIERLTFPSAQGKRNAERSAFHISHFVSRMHRSVRGTQRNSIAARLSFRLCCRMIRVSTSGSKLCACSTRLAGQRAYMPSVVAQLAKGEIPRLNPPVRLNAACGTRPRFHTSEVRR